MCAEKLPEGGARCTVSFRAQHLSEGVLTTGSRPALPQCGNEGVILYGLCSRDVNQLPPNAFKKTYAYRSNNF